MYCRPDDRRTKCESGFPLSLLVHAWRLTAHFFFFMLTSFFLVITSFFLVCLLLLRTTRTTLRSTYNFKEVSTKSLRSAHNFWELQTNFKKWTQLYMKCAVWAFWSIVVFLWRKISENCLKNLGTIKFFDLLYISRVMSSLFFSDFCFLLLKKK